MATERLLDFPAKTTPVPADIVYVGDSSDGYNEVKSTIEQIISAYPNLIDYANLSLTANTISYVDNTSTLQTSTITSLALTLLADSTAAAMRSTLGLGSAATFNSTDFLQVANNLSDLNSASTARTNLGLGTMATQSASDYLAIIGGTMAGIINMGSHKITNLTDPSSAQDAVTLSYLSTSLGSYLPLTGGTLSGNLNMGSNRITNLQDPVSSQDAATRAYVDSVATGFTVQPACYAATTGALTATYANGASGIGATLTNSGALAQFTTDGTTPPTNARILVWVQASSLQNGIYTLTNQGSGAVAWVLTRATDYDQPSEISPGDLVVINNGTAYGGTSFIETASVAAVGTDAISFSQFTFSASSVLLKANNLSDVANANTSFNNISPLTTKGDIVTYSTVNARLAVGASNGMILQVSSGAATGLAWSTATYPTSTTINRILYSSSNNVVGQISSVNSAVLSTNGSGVPAFSTTLPSGLTIPGYAVSGSNADITSMSGLNGYLQAPLGTKDANGNINLLLSSVASSVNYLSVSNAATGTAPAFSVVGTDSNISMGFSVKGTGAFAFAGNSTSAAKLNLYENSGNGSNYCQLRVAEALTNDTVYQYQDTGGTVYSTYDSVSTPAWTSFSGGVGYTGFSANPTGLIARYKKIGNTCFVQIGMTAGTSNATGFTITGLPFTSAAIQQIFPMGSGTDNGAGTTKTLAGVIAASSTTMTCVIGGNGAGWTNANGKAIQGTFCYETA